jgi:hypothetical protein
MHRVGPGLRRRFEDLADVQVGFRRALAAQRVPFIRHRRVQGVQVRVGMDGRAGQARVPCRPG